MPDLDRETAKFNNELNNDQRWLKFGKINMHYNIASRAAQLNSVYVRVLKIPLVHADSLSKSLRQNFFFAREAIVSARKNIIFRDNYGYKQRLGQPVPKRRQFCDLFSSVREKQRKCCLIFRLPRTITSDIVVRFSRRIWCTIPPAML